MSVEEKNKELIRLTDVNVRFGARTILSDVNLHIDEGDFLAITGPNGGGKSTLLRVILRLLKPTTGDVRYTMVDAGSFKIGYLPQKSSIDPRFPITVREVVESGLYGTKDLLKQARREMVDAVLDEVGMLDRSESAIGELSGGQVQRTLLARAIVSSPQMLVMDEPLSYVDKQFEHRIYDLMRRLADITTIILVSHEMNTIATIANRHIIVDHKLEYCHSANHFIHYDCCDEH
ncbi:MAG: ABC transporter ATP-binding protein [Bacteroides sp.]|nr:ABC transporter ATP-binding protein [Bacteroides sp.]MCM1413101.1 ABC transporter ATP-binding protein [Bacteroides sp.]MCM1472157.1 ABC transporter ATP-binding protein [Bacteroides sp.]